MKTDVWQELLGDAGLEVPADATERLEQHAAMVRQWNRVVSLVSQSDLEHLWERHVVDSLSLAPYVREACHGGKALVDIGSGAGFPAAPLKIVLPELRVVLVERSDRKVGFLRNVLRSLGVNDVGVVFSEFPCAVGDVAVGAVTARAVEKPEKLVPRVLGWLPEGAVFLCQAGEGCLGQAGMFHVEHVEDAWTERGLRRGELRVVRR